MNFGERTRGVAENTLRWGAVGAAVVGMYYGGKAYFDISHSDSTVQSSVIEQPKRDYFADFTVDGTKIELTTVLASQGTGEGMRYITIWGRAPKDPSAAISTEEWKFEMASGAESYDATLSVLPLEAGSNEPLQVVIIALVPETLEVNRLDISYNVPNSESQHGGVGDRVLQTIPLPVPSKSQNRT